MSCCELFYYFIEKIKSDKPDDYEGRFIAVRDLCFLEEAKNVVAKEK